jgi:dethiobiotin synthetase
MAKIIVITGTDTGVGKTVLTALLLRHLRRENFDALAMKPFCSGGRGDGELLRRFQKKCLTLDEVNPFYFRDPLSPAIAAKNEGREITFSEVKARIRAVAAHCEILLLEGAGGVLSPLGPGYSTIDLILEIADAAIIVGKNRLGTINHTLLTLETIQTAAVKPLVVVLMSQKKADFSAKTNVEALKDVVGGMPVFLMNYLGKRADCYGEVKKSEKKVKKLLHAITEVLVCRRSFVRKTRVGSTKKR